MINVGLNAIPQIISETPCPLRLCGKSSPSATFPPLCDLNSFAASCVEELPVLPRDI
jgi:hypothetical protein